MTNDSRCAEPAHSQPPDVPGGGQDSSKARWRTRGLIALAVIAVATSAVTLIPGASSSRKSGDRVTHVIGRRDLVVTITEQGTLESSDNTEIKCRVRGQSTVIWVVEGGTEVQPGDELVKLDTLTIEDAISERTKVALLTRSGAERARADVARAKLAISEYLEGRYRAQLMTLKKDLAIAESNLRSAQSMLAHAQMLVERGYESGLTVEERVFQVTQAELNVEVKNTEIEVLQKYTKKMELESLNGQYDAALARLAAEEERARMEAERRDLAIEELEGCVIKAERSGLVIYPSAAKWKNVPEIEEGATVHKDQVLLLMPDLAKMQVKVGVHESIVQRIKPGFAAKVTLPGRTLDGVVDSVAAVTRPAGWWTGNVVKYDTIVKLPSAPGLRPGMSAAVDVVLARHTNALVMPVKAVVQTPQGDFCWVETADGPARRALELGDTDDEFIVVTKGVKEGEEVVLDPLAVLEEAQREALRPFGATRQRAQSSFPTKSMRDRSAEANQPAKKPEIDHAD